MSERSRRGGVVSWVGWHIGELTGVIVPAVVALTVTPWAAVVSVVVGAGWVVHEVRLARRHAVIVPRRALPALDAGAAGEEPDAAAGWGAR